MNKLIYILTLFCLIGLIACKPNVGDVIKPSEVKNAAQKKKGTQKNPSKEIDKAFWAAAKKEANVGPIQATEIRKIAAKYNKQIEGLKKSNKWDGMVNDKTRRMINESKEDELRKLLVKKYPKYTAFKKQWAVKKASKK